METTVIRNGFSSKDEFKKSLEDIEPYYSYGKANFFTYTDSIYKSIIRSQYKDNADIKSYLRTIYLGIDCIRDEGWQFPKWQENERRDMLPALLALYDIVEGFDWSKMNEISRFSN
jgi:hypothetical protein